MVENHFFSNFFFQFDGGGEFVKTDFVKHTENCGILHFLSCAYTPKQNGIVERKYRHIVEMDLTLMFHAFAPKYLSIDAFDSCFPHK